MVLSVGAFGQHSILVNKFNFYLDYQNTHYGWWDYGDDNRHITFGGELLLNKMFSVEGGYSYDGNGYMPFSGNFGMGAGGYLGYKFDNIQQDAWMMIRLYPYEQFHSESIRIRHKDNYGFYFAMGYSLSNYRRRNVQAESHSTIITDPTTGEQYIYERHFLHYNGYRITQWGQQFGFGWKQFHNRFVYTDIGMFSDVFRKKNRNIVGWRIPDSSLNGEQYIPDEYWDYYMYVLENFSKNGRGFIFRAMIGINLDIYK